MVSAFGIIINLVIKIYTTMNSGSMHSGYEI
jgi:hypothetical protein